jgi:hypothetical protein
MADGIAPRNINQRLALPTAFQSFGPLMLSKGRLATELNASGLGSLSAFACQRQDQVTFKLRKPTKHSEHQSTMRSGCVGSLVAK